MSFNIHPLPQNQPPPRTGQAFLHRLHGSGWKDIWVASSGGWGGGRAGDILTSFPVSTGHYYSAAHIRKGATTRSNATFESLWAIVIDDVGTSAGSNLDLDEHRLLLPEPTAIIETSENNFQWLYALAAPEPDVVKIGAAFAALKLHPLLGPGFKDTADLTHYFRLPGGVNPKPGKESFSTACRELDLANRHDFDQLMLAFGIDLPTAMAAAPAARAPASAPSEQIPVARIRAMFDALPNNFDRWAWLSMAHAVAAATQGEPAEARDAFVAWSATHVPKDGRTPAEVVREAERVWDTLGDDHKAGAGTLRKHLEQGASRYEDRIALDPGEGFTEEVDVERVSAAIKEVSRSETDAKVIDDLIRQLRAAGSPPAVYAGLPDPGDSKSAPIVAYSRNRGPNVVYPAALPGLIRGHATQFVGMPGAGKSAYAIACGLAVVHNRPDLIGAPPGSLNPKLLGDVVIVANEDVLPELERRIEAAELRHKLSPTPAHDIHLTRSELIEKRDNGRFQIVCERLLRDLIAIRKQRDIALIVIDTLASALVGVEENSQSEMTRVTKLVDRIAWAAFAAVAIIHHPSKSAAGNDDAKRSVFAGRGSGAPAGSARAVANITSPSAEEKQEFGFSKGQMKSVVVCEWSKFSWGREPDKTFFEKTSEAVPMVDMDGTMVPGNALVVVPFTPRPPSAFELEKKVLDALRGGRKPRYKPTQKAKSTSGTGLDELTGIDIGTLHGVVERLVGEGKVRLRNTKDGGTNSIGIIEIVEEFDEENGGI